MIYVNKMWAVTELYLVCPKQVAASAVGLARRALEEATKYSMERKTMGKPIFQVKFHFMCLTSERPLFSE